MLSLNRKTDYALVALAYLAERAQQYSSAREIAAAHSLPLPLLMNILKALHQAGLLRSSRGVRGGYQIAADLESVSLHDLTAAIERVDRPGDGVKAEPECCGQYRISSPRPVHGPIQAFHSKLRRFLHDVKVSDLVVPGRRIDVPVELVSAEKNGNRRSRDRAALQSTLVQSSTLESTGVALTASPIGLSSN